MNRRQVTLGCIAAILLTAGSAHALIASGEAATVVAVTSESEAIVSEVCGQQFSYRQRMVINGKSEMVAVTADRVLKTSREILAKTAPAEEVAAA